MREVAREILEWIERATDGRSVIAVYVNPEEMRVEWGYYANITSIPKLTFYITNPVDLKNYYADWDFEEAVRDFAIELEERFEKAIENDENFQKWLFDYYKEEVKRILEAEIEKRLPPEEKEKENVELSDEEIFEFITEKSLKEALREVYFEIDDEGNISLPNAEYDENRNCISIGNCLEWQSIEETKFFKNLNRIIEKIDNNAEYEIEGQAAECCTEEPIEGYVAAVLADFPCKVFEDDCSFKTTIKGKELKEILEEIKEMIYADASVEVEEDYLATLIELNGYPVRVYYKSLQNPYAYTDEKFSIWGDGAKGGFSYTQVFLDRWHCGGTYHSVSEFIEWNIIEGD